MLTIDNPAIIAEIDELYIDELNILTATGKVRDSGVTKSMDEYQY